MVFGSRPVILSVIQKEEGSISVLFSLEDGDSWTDVTGRSGFDGKDDGMRIGGSNGRRRRATTNGVLNISIGHWTIRRDHSLWRHMSRKEGDRLESPFAQEFNKKQI